MLQVLPNETMQMIKTYVKHVGNSPEQTSCNMQGIGDKEAEEIGPNHRIMRTNLDVSPPSVASMMIACVKWSHGCSKNVRWC